jgi:hypothetical protein
MKKRGIIVATIVVAQVIAVGWLGYEPPAEPPDGPGHVAIVDVAQVKGDDPMDWIRASRTVYLKEGMKVAVAIREAGFSNVGPDTHTVKVRRRLPWSAGLIPAEVAGFIRRSYGAVGLDPDQLIRYSWYRSALKRRYWWTMIGDDWSLAVRHDDEIILEKK